MCVTVMVFNVCVNDTAAASYKWYKTDGTMVQNRYQYFSMFVN